MSLVTLGQRTRPPDLVGALEDCHARIRRFIAIAHRLAGADLDPDALRAGAHDVKRYFAEALPQHVADEDLLEVWLAGRDPALDAVFATMRVDHAAHAGHVAALIEVCEKLERSTGRHAELAPTLARLAAHLEAAFASHLEIEERELFPRLAALSAEERRRLQQAIRERRDRVLAKSPT